MENIIFYLKNKYKRWGWLGQRAHDAVGINKILPLDFIICCDYGTETGYFFNKKLISLEKKNKKRLNWSNENLNEVFEGKYADKFMYLLNTSKVPLNILCYRSIRKLEDIKLKNPNKLNIYAVSEFLKRKFDNKVSFRKTLSKLGITPIPGETINLEDFLFERFRRKFGVPFIVQFPYGSSGMKTYKIKQKKDYVDLCRESGNSQVNVLRFIKGYSLNINGIVIERKKRLEVHLTHPSFQLTGVPECSSYPTMFCGNDYTSANKLKDNVLNKIEFITKTVGKYMGEQGYRGIFGLDILVNEHTDEVYPVEINPRFQNSTGLLTELETINKNTLKHLFLLHIIEFLKKSDKYLKDFSDKFDYSSINQKLKGAQIILHNFLYKSMVIGKLLPGIYNYNNKKLVFERKGVSLSECESDKEILITCGVPLQKQSVAAFAPICKIQTKNSVLSSDYKKLNKKMHNIVDAVYRKLQLKRIS